MRKISRAILLAIPLCLLVLGVTAQAYIAPQPSGNLDGEVPAPLPVYVPLVHTEASSPALPAIQGRILLGDAPFVDATVGVRGCTGTAVDGTLAFTATSDAVGRFSLPLAADETLFGRPISLTLGFTATRPITVSVSQTQTLSAWGTYRSACLGAGTYPHLALPEIDLEAPVFITPSTEITVDMPVIFTWRARHRPLTGERLQWRGSVQFDCQGCPPRTVESQTLEATSTSLEWCAIAPISAKITDVVWVDYTLRVTNTLGSGETLRRRSYVGATLAECPPLPE